MNNIYFGIATIALCTIALLYSLKLHQQGRYMLAISLMMLSGFLLRIYTACDFYLHEWDERFHALVTKHMLLHPLKPTLYENTPFPYDYTRWSASHVWLHKQPLPLWTIAYSFKLFGINELALRLPSIVLTTIGIALTYSIARYFADRKAAWFAAFLYCINGFLIELATGRVATDHIDTFFCFSIELSIFFAILYAQKKKTSFNILTGICLGAAILSKWLSALIVLPIWLLLAIDNKLSSKIILPQFILLCAVTIAISLPWQLYIFHYYPLEARYEAAFNYQHIIKPLEGNGGSAFFYIDKIRINYGEYIYLPLLWFIYKTYKKPTTRYVILWVWFGLPFLFFSFVQTKMPGYTAFTAPALFIITAICFYELLQYRTGKWKWLVTIVLLAFIVLPIRYTIERIKPFDKRERSPRWVAQLKALNKIPMKNAVLLNYPAYIEAMFYTNMTAYNYLPTKEAINEIQLKEYDIWINDNGNVPKDVHSLQGVHFIKLLEPMQ